MPATMTRRQTRSSVEIVVLVVKVTNGQGRLTPGVQTHVIILIMNGLDMQQPTTVVRLLALVFRLRRHRHHYPRHKQHTLTKLRQLLIALAQRNGITLI